MIKIVFYKNRLNQICGFRSDNHSDPIVCSAVSALTINTINSIEAFCFGKMSCEHNDGGFLKMLVDEYDSGVDEKTKLLLDSLELGITAISLEYKKNVTVSYEEV